ncbi:BFD-like [2Fe-2S] binding domain-containing protein [Thermosyntropha lipolytica DSM 11003]|uniref:BFD-like [2Fe-2S] binding domain-containing protein n=1 Tax=Thermosyntropha lipolytica DSM 11003 TaxID=1123382 RepID=A0A1M5RIT7_9FIRM|nr:(2Fe-2S)-binding protein [Thermosyntropha lipolytica]SHH26217.1 BFD-like [2Fe-2S] binding domain-containing protein [Thermosyntropha lipolytica DSM 11003]
MASLDKTEIISKQPVCPLCNTRGKKVLRRTVENLCPGIRLEDGPYYLCLSPACNIGYYTSSGQVIPKDRLKVPIWFKEESPVPVCYCQQVTDEEIWKHVAVDKCCSTLEDIQKHTGANTGCRCVETNPAGT